MDDALTDTVAGLLQSAADHVTGSGPQSQIDELSPVTDRPSESPSQARSRPGNPLLNALVGEELAPND